MMAVTLLDPPVCVGTFVVPGSLGGQLPPEGRRGFALASAQHLTAVVFRPGNTGSLVGSLTHYYPRSACYQSAGGWSCGQGPSNWLGKPSPSDGGNSLAKPWS
ncbi:arginine transporter [Erwinia amylovora]|uniref:Arginine exporter protein argO n=2 Tax=Erwinia amylovora TaxID=552 RepID=A0A831ER85_ERWAM|nr:arginine transporter [Erwinia amylovora]EKV55484.1 Arginine exporter protein argO [Erwinia amylovora ACW56400]CBA19578.1 Arginine exporter protein argO [Erwinia amylovora CFBP1430]CCO77481.1 Arginine exporter protein argO [Erwinia amylovora Ea356]CCO81266.1 Arginine exporter protein argO [Erwinia amylovora Ea266]CCO85072.1 Arginine exporter protein argO [Erwinia amylovora CFBP 2585]CCO88854.1 Arginine exporter protein argO [Erwinia amylovora 01SFR-BO]CCO92611.1 Arginine exporter protein a